MNENHLIKNTFQVSSLNFSRNKAENIELFIKYSWRLTFVALIFQVFISPVSDNFICLSIVIVSWYIICKTFLSYYRILDFPISSIVIIGFVITQLWLPLIVTSIEFKPLIYNLTRPVDVFFHSALTLIVLITSHFFYRIYFKNLLFSGRKLLAKSGFFETPTDTQLWMMGFIGLLSIFYTYFYSPSVGNTVESTGDKFIQGFSTFTYAPFFMFVGELYGRENRNINKLYFYLYIFLLLILSVGANSRGKFIVGFASLGISWFWGILISIYKVKRYFSIKNTILILLVFWLISSPLSDLGTAMVMVRAQRNDVSRVKLLELTIDQMSDKEALNAHKINSLIDKRDWDERYVNNLFLARFCNIKFNDSSLNQASKVKENDNRMLEYSIDRFWAILPNPFIEFLGIELDKKSVTSMSFGDYLYSIGDGGISAIGGYRVGHFAGTGMAAFGWLYLLILAILIIPVYLLIDLFYLKYRLTKEVNVRFSLCGLFLMSFFFTLMQVESIIVLATFIVRGWIQLCILYISLFVITSKIQRLKVNRNI